MNHIVVKTNETKAISEKFDYLIKLDNKFNIIINEVFLKQYEIIAKYMISEFQISFLKNFNKFLEETSGDEFDSHMYYSIHSQLNNLADKLVIRNSDDLEKLSTIIKLSSIFMEDSFNNKDIDCFFESFYQLNSNIYETNLVNKEIAPKFTFDVEYNPNIEVYHYEY